MASVSQQVFLQLKCPHTVSIFFIVFLFCFVLFCVVLFCFSWHNESYATKLHNMQRTRSVHSSGSVCVWQRVDGSQVRPLRPGLPRGCDWLRGRSVLQCVELQWSWEVKGEREEEREEERMEDAVIEWKFVRDSYSFLVVTTLQDLHSASALPDSLELHVSNAMSITLDTPIAQVFLIHHLNFFPAVFFLLSICFMGVFIYF